MLLKTNKSLIQTANFLKGFCDNHRGEELKVNDRVKFVIVKMTTQLINQKHL